MEKKTVIHWFRKGLRIHDNPALLAAIEEAVKSSSALRPIFILDPLILTWMRVGPNRWRFLQQSLDQLNENLTKIGSKLYVIRGTPENVFKRIFKDWNISYITYEYDTEPYAKRRDALIEQLAHEANIRIESEISHTIYNTQLVIKKNGGKAPLTMQKFLSVVDSMSKPPIPVPAPTKIPEICKPTLDSFEKENPHCYDCPTLLELKVNEKNLNACKFPGGETEALNRLNKILLKKSWICNFEKPNTSSNSLEPSTTVLSPYLKFGCLSSRLFYYEINKIISGQKHSKPPVSLIGQLMWREFYYTVSSDTPNFDKMVGNPICCQVPWDTNEKHLEAWTYGKTGYPFIDAIMRQLRQEGWIHHLARHAVACFLTRGDLWISWEEGLKVFDELLLDSDWALNAGNWMWLSASAFFHQFFRVYSPVAFGKKTDKFGDYIKKYVPELNKYPVDYIYEPWKAPLSVQTKAGCLIGKDYPKRIVIHEDVYKVNISKMSLAYKNNKTNDNNKQKGESSKESEPAAKKMKKVSKSTNTTKSDSKKSKQTSLTKFLKK
ncbi:cryptochrome-1 [Chrysoperla carnea]|uniref:cryptochrome-1 n=1 Tax=Chrysoperla carnea TaxID=189513 RepID=UPI001D08E794|nr:cryptochrome-1 [Chrysoperla carnea]XP_044742492.1 cryptochrome-1 [Chrysoperla carnea]